MPLPPLPAESSTQDGLFTVRQARASGLSTRRIRSMVSSGRWIRVLGDVLVPAGTAVTGRQRLRAAELATGGVVSHASAARLWGLPTPAATDAAVHVTVTRADHPRVDGVRLHRRWLAPGDRNWLYGIAVTSRLRTVGDCLLTWRRPDAEDLVHHLLRTGLLSTAALQELPPRSKRAHGIAQLVDVVESAVGGSWSAAERRLHDVMRAAGILGWVANHAIVLPDGRRVVVDVWFPEQRVVVEVDGHAWHVSRERFETDRVRQNALVLLGCTVLRFTWKDLHDGAERVVREIRLALSSG